MHCPECGHVFDMGFLKGLYDELCKTFSIDKSRSVKQHNRFFSMIDKAFNQWPEQYEFQPLDKEHLRAWLLCKAGHRHIESVDVNVLALSPKEQQLMRMAYETPFRRSKGKKKTKLYRFWHIHRGHAFVIEPKSQSFEEMDHDDACKIMRAVDELVCDVLGIGETEELFAKRNKAA